MRGVTVAIVAGLIIGAILCMGLETVARYRERMVIVETRVELLKNDVSELKQRVKRLEEESE